tara:strand:- start:518 stop:1453 length:936 start_codon:yes stop_codon:yes gene_type:complete
LSYAQNEFYSCSESGELILSNSEECSINSLGYYTLFSDIAVTPNGTLYGVSDYIYKIDTNTQTELAIGLPFEQNAPAGLVAIDDDNLLFDIDDSLFTYSISADTRLFLGVIGYYCNGDFAFFGESLYMISASNDLIKIEVNIDLGYIQAVENIGQISTPGLSYSLFTAYDSCDSQGINLYLLDSYNLYQIDSFDASATLICNIGLGQSSAGAASLNSFIEIDEFDNIPNVFTPNGDMINDTFYVEQNDALVSFLIFNRWGNKLYEWESGEVRWSGVNDSGKTVEEGVYFYSMNYKGCGEILNKTGHITLIR